MDEYRERQRQRWTGDVPPRTVTPPPEPVLAATSIKKLHIVPISLNLEETDRVESTVVFLKIAVAEHRKVESGLTFADSSDRRFVVVRTEPEMGGFVDTETDFFVSGPPAIELEKLQLVGLADRDLAATGDADSMFTTVLGPFVQARLGEGKLMPLWINQSVSVGNDRFVATAMEPAPEGVGLVTSQTTVFLDLEDSGDFARVHVLPFQDTLPRVYDFDVFEDYLKPFFNNNPLALFSVNTQFAFHGVQFKVVCVDPSDGRPRRIGPNTLIHCEGLLHATLRNMLPPELLGQLSTLPPGLQMLLINTELLASADVLDRFIDLQETLAARRGVSQDVLDSLPTEQFKSPAPGIERPESATQCMICLSDFEEGETLRRLPCTHVFHQPCIDEWLLHRSTQCCLCKADVSSEISEEYTHYPETHESVIESHVITNRLEPINLRFQVPMEALSTSTGSLTRRMHFVRVSLETPSAFYTDYSVAVNVLPAQAADYSPYPASLQERMTLVIGGPCTELPRQDWQLPTNVHVNGLPMGRLANMIVAEE